MIRRNYLFFAILTATLALSSCSGTHNHCMTNCNTGGNASLSVTLAAIPFVPPPTTSILSLAVAINSVSLTPTSGGSVVNVPLNATVYSVDLTKLQSDSSFLGQVVGNVPAGTYNKVTVGVTLAVVTSCTATGGTPGCNAGSVAQITAGAAAPATSSFSLTLADNQHAGLQVLFNLGNAITVNPATQAVTGLNLAAANVLTAVPLPPTASTLSAGQFDYLEDVTGVVTAASASSVTVQTSTRGSFTSVVTGSTIGSPNCVITNAICSPAVGQVASIDATLNSDGTSTLLEYDPLSPTSVDIIEGTVTTVPSSSTQFQIVTNDLTLASSNSLFGNKLTLGEPVNITYAGTNPFAVDTKGLLPITNTPFTGGTSANDILPGQTVALRVTAFTPKAGATPAAATVDFVVLRFTRVAGSVSSSSPPTFGIQSLPPFFGQTTSNLVQLSTTTTPITYLDGYSASGNITVGDTVALRGLYFGVGFSPAFTAAKVRKH
ncbi:MAG TPA: hypothetical protein VNI81_15095 [Candidatus Limnocylindrales bacterium]|nr:hypothetical protein [Candidatus Limnocylindrales bacterium]